MISRYYFPFIIFVVIGTIQFVSITNNNETIDNNTVNLSQDNVTGIPIIEDSETSGSISSFGPPPDWNDVESELKNDDDGDDDN